ncbi:MAG: c-type cytochrome [Verrucomicrobiaceae bacterium]|nr:c-type cytochrome [Verrucomicrobiaceae bacterium]
MNKPSNNEPQLREHVYDGIQEYDQKLPNWWLFTLYITIVWFVIHWAVYYQGHVGRTDEQRLDDHLKVIADARAKELENVTDDKLWELSQDPTTVEAGKQTFLTTCAACHAPDLSATLAGAKLPGLPLKDKEWKHGGNPLDVLHIVRKGAPDITKGMVAWEGALGVKRITEVVAFIMSHHKKGEPFTLAADSPKKAGAAAPATVK